MNAQAYDQYRKTSVESASPGRLLLMLFEGAIRFVDNAKRSIDEKDIESAHNNIIKAQNIMLQLMSSLNMEYEISNQLFNLYEYIYYQLMMANTKKDLAILAEVRELLSDFQKTWDEAIKKAGSSKSVVESGMTEGINIKG
ncbi:flagellar export chaperone FliS [Syntrophomonas palmitatica]|uniref:flagellar export chaperone FliS n=1 Tax=Syntrophomonas palmitatica TaxID=402877 RepID=UPI0006D1A01A|nr:flagellar export chaperone FliS [Syntrophomonas palmitatica]